MPSEMHGRLLKSHEQFYCPSGHSQHFTGKTEEQKLREQLAEQIRFKEASFAREKSALAEAEHFRKARDGMKGALVRTQKRVRHGVCPCCTRSFPNLAAHMATKHPDYSQKVEA